MGTKKVWVLYGGASSEREVSLRSGAGIFEALQSRGFAAELFDVRPETLGELPWDRAPDIVFIGLHGAFGEDGVLQGYLEARGVPYVGSGVLSSALCMHKGLSLALLRQAGVPVAESFEIRGSEDFWAREKNGLLPANFFARKWFIKPSREGSTVGIQRFSPETSTGTSTDARAHFRQLLEVALKHDRDVVIERWLEGPELTVPVLQGKALPIVEIRPKSHFYDYASKYTKGASEYLCPAPLTPAQTAEVQAAAEKVFSVLRCDDYGRVDVMLTSEGPYVLEMNTLPGMTETSLVPKSAAAAGLSYADFVEKLVNGSLQKWKEGSREKKRA